MTRLWRDYAAWTRTQASAMNCGHLVLGGAAAVIAAAVVAELYWAVIVEVARIAALCLLGAAALALGWGCYRAVRFVRARLAAHEVLAADGYRPGPPAVPCARRCGRAADGEVTWANGVRSGTEALCRQCEDETADIRREFLAYLDARREREAGSFTAAARPAPGLAPSGTGFLSGGPVLDPAAEAAQLAEHPVPSSADNVPARDTGTAGDLAAVLRRASVYRPGHP